MSERYCCDGKCSASGRNCAKYFRPTLPPEEPARPPVQRGDGWGLLAILVLPACAALVLWIVWWAVRAA